MPPTSSMWRHVTIGTHSSWLHGNPKGFRSRKHRIHSSGDYRHRPPEGEHQNLFRHQQEHSAETITIASSVRQRVGESLRDKLLALGRNVLSVSIGGRHTHIVVLLWLDPVSSKRAVGQAKQKASHAVRDALPGQVWAEGGSFEPVETANHLREAVAYDRDHADEGAFVWLSDEAVAILEGRLDARDLMPR